MFQRSSARNDAVVHLYAANLHELYRIRLGRMPAGRHADTDSDRYSGWVYRRQPTSIDTELYVYRRRDNLHEFYNFFMGRLSGG